MKFVEVLREHEKNQVGYRNAMSNSHAKAVTALRQAELCEQMIAFVGSGHFDKAFELAQKVKALER